MSSVKKYFSDIWSGLATTLVGMRVTGKYAFKKPVTELYPHEKYQTPKGYRGILFCKIEDCTGCMACARACPVDCIHIKTQKRDAEDYSKASDGTPIKLWTTQFDIDMSLCMECGLCTEPCPTECLVTTQQYELAVSDKKEIYLQFAVDAERAAAAAARAAERAAAAAAAAAAAEAAAAGAGAPTPPAATAPAAAPAPAAGAAAGGDGTAPKPAAKTPAARPEVAAKEEEVA